MSQYHIGIKALPILSLICWAGKLKSMKFKVSIRMKVGREHKRKKRNLFLESKKPGMTNRGSNIKSRSVKVISVEP